MGPVTHFPMPPLPPLQPLPPQIVSSYATSEMLDARASTTHIPQPIPSTRPASMSFSSTVSSTTSTSTAVDSTSSSIFSGSETAHENTYVPASKPPFGVTQDESDCPVATNGSTPPRPLFKAELKSSFRDNISVLGPLPESLRGAFDEVSALSERSMAMHLYRAYQSVLACQEAMWEELKDRLRNKKDDLQSYGWDDDEELEELEELQNRKKFERLVDRYRGDMQARVSLWCSLSSLGWPIPPREPLSKAELIEEDRIHQGMLTARQFATEDDQPPCRTGRVIIGYKSF